MEHDKGKNIAELNHRVLACYATGDLEKGNRIARQIERAKNTGEHNKPRR